MNCRIAVVSALCALVLAGCAGAPLPRPDLSGLLPTPLLLLGEQHDAPEHQRLQRATVRELAAQGTLAAVVMEMVEAGHQTTGLAREADEAAVRQALDWTEERNSGGWAWAVYGPVVMEAVRAGVPVIGGNLPRAQMRRAMGDATLDAVLSPEALAQQREAIREGHCQMLPESQIAPMTRIQLARDQRMAAVALAAQVPGQTVLLIAGNAHVQRDLGVPRHWPEGTAHRVVQALAASVSASPAPADRVWLTPPLPPKDHCADMRQ